MCGPLPTPSASSSSLSAMSNDFVDLTDLDDDADINAAIVKPIPQDPYFNPDKKRQRHVIDLSQDDDESLGPPPAKKQAPLSRYVPAAAPVPVPTPAPTPGPSNPLLPSQLAAGAPFGAYANFMNNPVLRAMNPMILQQILMQQQGLAGTNLFGSMAEGVQKTSAPGIASTPNPMFSFAQQQTPLQTLAPAAPMLPASFKTAQQTQQVAHAIKQESSRGQPGLAIPNVSPAPVSSAPEERVKTVEQCILETSEIGATDDDDLLIDCCVIQSKIHSSPMHFGIAEPGDTVQLQPDPTHEHDPNAIRVENSLGIDVGYLSPGVAKTLAPLLEHKRVEVKGYITGDVQDGEPIPVTITVFAPPASGESLKSLFRHLKLIAPPPPPPSKFQPPQVPTPQPIISPAQQAAMIAAQRQQRALETWQQLLQVGQDLDPKSSQAILDSVGMKDAELANLPEAPHPAALMTELLAYQRQGLGWMLNAEHPAEPTESEENQFWQIRMLNGQRVFWNRATNSVAQGTPRLARGGILADDMGLGKTIQVLSLILCDLDGSVNGDRFVEHPGEVADTYCNSTLIVCPLSVVGNWVSQINQHVELGRLKYHIFHGPQRNRDIRFLQQHDIIITTYAVMALDTEDTPLHRIRWRRIVLDEGHNIRAKNTKQSKSACNLVAERKWVLSGTPLQNKLEDLYSLLKFIEFFPFDQWEFWKSTFDRPIKQGRPEAMELFKQLMHMLCLRRTKTMRLKDKPLLELPKISYVVHKIKFRPEERGVYAKWEAKSRRVFDRLIKEQQERQHARELGRYVPNGVQEGRAAQGLGNMLKYLTRLRQLCNHRFLAEKVHKKYKGGSIAHLRSVLREALVEDCPMCLAPMRTPSITPCLHHFCAECLRPHAEVTQSCPLCTTPLKLNQIVELPKDDEDDTDDPPADLMAGSGRLHFATDEFNASTKIDSLMTFLETCRDRDPSIKSVVFSQWTSMLNLLEIPLRARGFNFVRLDGTMQRHTRENAINKFQNDSSVTVFLISLTCGSTGLNLVAASNCFLVDPWWNPQIERQAIDRIYRIGQKRPVTVVRFAMENSIEERVLALQDKKRQMAEDAFGEQSAQRDKVSRSTRLEDIRELLGKASNGIEDDQLDDLEFDSDEELE